jgi:hypothetical protein
MTQRKKWSDFSSGRQWAIQVGGVIQVILLAAALWDLRRRPEEEINGNRRLWMGVVFINFVGPIAYFLFGRKR